MKKTTASVFTFFWLFVAQAYGQQTIHKIHEIDFKDVPLPPPFGCLDEAKEQLIELANEAKNTHEKAQYWGWAPDEDFIHKARKVLTFKPDLSTQTVTVHVPIYVSGYSCSPAPCHYTKLKPAIIDMYQSRLESDLNEAGKYLGLIFDVSIKNLLDDTYDSNGKLITPVIDLIRKRFHLHFRAPREPMWKKIGYVDINYGRSLVVHHTNGWWRVKSKAKEEFLAEAFDGLFVLDEKYERTLELSYTTFAHEATHFIFNTADAYKLSPKDHLQYLNANTCSDEVVYDRDHREPLQLPDGKEKSRRYDPVELLMFALRYNLPYNKASWATYVQNPLRYKKPYACELSE